MISQPKLLGILEQVQKNTISPEEAQSQINVLVSNHKPYEGICECSLPKDAYNGTGRCLNCKKIIGIDGRTKINESDLNRYNNNHKYTPPSFTA